MNILEIAGRLGVDPETRYTPDGQKVTSLRVACNVRKKGQEETMWWRVTLWGETFDRVLPYFKKGSAVIVVGEMQPPRIYNDRNGNPAVGLEMRGEIIRFNPFPSKNQDAEAGQKQYGEPQQNYGAPAQQQQPAQQPAYAGAAASQHAENSMSFGSSGSQAGADGGGFAGPTSGQGTAGMDADDEQIPF